MKMTENLPEYPRATWVNDFLPERAIICLTSDIVALPLLFSSGYLMVVLSFIAHYFATSCLSLFMAEVKHSDGWQSSHIFFVLSIVSSLFAISNTDNQI